MPVWADHQAERSETTESDLTVFCVAEAADAREAVVLLAGSLSLKVEVYKTVDEYIRGLDCYRPGCLVLDVPTARGAKLFEALASRGVFIPVIMIVDHEETATGPLKAVAFSVIQKPCQPQVLMDCIEAAVRRDAEAPNGVLGWA